VLLSPRHFIPDGRSVGRSVSLGVEPLLGLGPDVNVLSDHYGGCSHWATSLTGGRVCLVLVVLSLLGATIQKIKLFII